MRSTIQRLYGEHRTRRIPALLALALASVGLLQCDEPARIGPRQIIVLVTIDTLRADRIGTYGDESAITPNLDSLAQRGVRFDAAVSPTPLTLPSHASILTGLNPTGHGVHHNARFRLPDEIPSFAEQLQGENFATAAFVSATVLDRQYGLARGFDVYDDTMELADAAAGVLSVAERRADHTVDRALAWAASAPEHSFLWVHLYDPHWSYTPPTAFLTASGGDGYAGEISFADQELGRLLRGLEDRFDEATYIVTSDHGESLGEHDELTHSHTLYEATQRVPLILAGSGLPVGLAVSEVVRLIDIAPTILELAGAPALPGIHGATLVSLIRGAEQDPRPAYLETIATHVDMGWSPLYGLRLGDMKLIRAPRPELYDLAADPKEQKDLASERPDQVAFLQQILDEEFAKAIPYSPNLSVSPEQRARLESLGYVAEAPDELTLGTTTGTDPKDERHLVSALHEATDLVGVGRHEDALQRLETLGRRGRDIEHLRAWILLRMGRLDEAQVAAEGAIAMDPANPEGPQLLGFVYWEQGRLVDAERELRRAVSLGPSLGKPLVLLGELVEGRGDLAEARLLYEQARAARVPDPSATWLLAALDIEAGDLASARGLLAELAPHHLQDEGAARRLGAAELRANRPEIALARIDAGISAQPESVALLRLKGTALERLGKLEQALDARERALALATDDPISMNDVAWTLALLRRSPDRALSLSRLAHKALPESAVILDTLAKILLQQGDPEATLLALTLAPKDTASTVPLLLRRAEALRRLDRVDEARRALAQASTAPSAERREWDGELERMARRLGP